MKILHTADWHLGQTLHGVPRTIEHAAFLSWLLSTLESEEVDALVVAGDVFDSANPSPNAQEAYYGFLAECRRRMPELSIAIVGGNHDSPERLDAPRSILDAIRISVSGGLPRGASGELDLERALVPLFDRDRQIGAWLLAVPFLRRQDLPAPTDESPDALTADLEDAHGRLVAGHRTLYQALTRAAKARRARGQALIATGHAYMVGGVVSELSERKIQAGNQHALPADIFPDELAYVALGHLHRAQPIGGRENVRYSGSPIPLSLAEKGYEHQVLLLEIGGDRLRSLRPVFVPRTIDLLTVPEVHAPLVQVLERLRELPRARRGDDVTMRPYLEVRVLLDSASPRLRQDIEAALEDAWARLLKIDARMERSLCDVAQRAEPLGTTRPEAVFRATYQKQRGGPVPEEILTLFTELVEDLAQR